MQFLKIAAVVLFLLPIELHAQRNVRVFEAYDFVGKTVPLEGKVIKVDIDPKTNVVNIGLSYWRNKTVELTLLIHLKNIPEAKRTYYNGLLDKIITFKGKLEKIDGKMVVDCRDGKVDIDELIPVNQF